MGGGWLAAPENSMKFALPLVAVAAAAVAAYAAAPAGLKCGDKVSAFHIKHVSGPLANKVACFPCTFQNRPQVQVWVNGDTEANVGAIAKALDKQMTVQEGKEFKALIVLIHNDANKAKVEALAQSIPGKYGAKQIAVALAPEGDKSVANYKIDLSKKNTVYAYKNWTVVETWNNVDAKKDGKALNAAVTKLVN